MNATARTVAAVLVLAGLAAGCASVSVLKLDAVTGKVAEGTPEGLRFYLPRPYVSVFEPFIIASEVYLATGEVSPDGNYVLLTQVPPGLDKLVNKDLADGKQTTMGELKVDASQVRVVERGGGSPQSAAAAPAAPASAASAADAKKPEISGGLLNYKATNDNSAYAVTPQPRYFNILWLPDFDEQYVVSAKAGLGNAGVVLGFGQGWSLQSLEATVDNSALAKPLLDFYSGTLAALQKVATAKIEGPLGALTGGPQSVSAATFKGGTRVTVKVTKVRIVAPGLYPILKPKEAVLKAEHAASAALDESQAKRILAPVQPLTNIAFNTYDVIVIEAARTTGDSALRIQQYVDSTGTGASAGKGADDRSAGSGGESLSALDSALRELRIELSKPENTSVSKEYFVPSIARDATGIVKVKLTKRPDGTAGALQALPDDATLKAKVIEFLKAKGVVVATSDVDVVR